MYNVKKKLIIIPIIVIVLLAGIITILYFTTDLFKSNETLFWKYFAQAEDITKVITNDKKNAQESFKETNSYTANGNVQFVLSQGEDSQKQFNATTTARHDINTDRTYEDITLKNGELDILKASYINSGDIYGIKCDEVFYSYIGIQNSNLTELGQNYGIENIPNTIEKNEYENLLDLTDAQKQHLVDIYLPIIKNHISKEQYSKSKEDIEINGETYRTNVYKIEISGDDLNLIAIDILNALKSDTETLMIISEKMSKIGFGTENTDTANIVSEIDKTINELQATPIQENLSINIYENDGENVRTQIVFGSKINLTFDRIANRNKLSVDIVHTKNVEEADGEIIDLNALAEETNITSRIIVEKNADSNITTNNIQIIPDLKKAEENIEISISLGSIQDNQITNAYVITLNQYNEDKKNTISITYDNNIVKAENVEEIEELTGSNTAIANNYTKEQFTSFAKLWGNIFIDKLTEKMETLGLEEISGQLEKLNIE